MMILRFKSKEDHEYLLKKVKKMREFAEDLEDCLAEVMEEGEANYRGARYREHDFNNDELESRSRYNYRRGESRSRM